MNMNETKTLRDELSMSAPFCYPEQYKLDATSTDQQMEAEIRARYRYADIALRVKVETMPKVERQHPKWARYAIRFEDGPCVYCSGTPQPWMDGNGKQIGWEGFGSTEPVQGDTSFIPTNWRESKVKL